MGEQSHQTLVIPRHNNELLLLGMKKTGFGAGNWNGFGGKVEEKDNAFPAVTHSGFNGMVCEETFKNAAIRELQEECGLVVSVKELIDIGVLKFIFTPKPDNMLFVHTYFVDVDDLDILRTCCINETDEMRPSIFSIEHKPLYDSIPYKLMWPDDSYWLPLALKGCKIYGAFTFNENNELTTIDMSVLKR